MKAFLAVVVMSVFVIVSFTACPDFGKQVKASVIEYKVRFVDRGLPTQRLVVDHLLAVNNANFADTVTEKDFSTITVFSCQNESDFQYTHFDSGKNTSAVLKLVLGSLRTFDSQERVSIVRK